MRYLAFAAISCFVFIVGYESSDSSSQTAVSIVSQGYETPDTAILMFYEGLAEHDLEKVKSAAVLNDKVLAYLQANVRLFQSMDSFAKTDAEYFGSDGAMPAGWAGKQAIAALQGKESEIVDETHATFAINANSPMQLLKGPQAGWKVDFTRPEYTEFLELSTDAFGRTTSMFVQLRSKVVDGSVRTREELRSVMAKLKSEYRL